MVRCPGDRSLVPARHWQRLRSLPRRRKERSPWLKAELTNPTEKYPRPPYKKKQSQPWPGLASRMDPPPDHGEKSYRGSGRLTGRKALITGGASGMGRAAAIAFAREGADVAINYYPTEEPDARQVLELIRAEKRNGIAIPGDIRDEKFRQELVRRAVEGLGGLDIVVSNAGRQQARQSILDLPTEDFDATMKTNIYAPFWIIKAALPHLKPGSVIIGTTSEQAYDPSPDLYDYAQTKAAMMNYVKSLAEQLGPKGIRVNGVAPGPITPLQVSGGAAMEKLKNSAARRRSAALASRQNSARSTYSWQQPMPAMPPAKSTAPRVAQGSLEKQNSGLGLTSPEFFNVRHRDLSFCRLG
jgi:NAD(P)-dependent dehydrogenase (short-subunit alcohol dehydrogenase family)